MTSTITGSTAAASSTSSAETPLRALNSDITANGGSGFIRWRANESREWKLAVSPSHFSDGNDRVEALLTGREGVYSAPSVQVDLGLEVGTSHNSKSDDVPYFNPKSDFSVLPTVNVNHVLYHRYETSWSQQFQAGAGTYSQRDHGTGGMACWATASATAGTTCSRWAVC